MNGELDSLDLYRIELSLTTVNVGLMPHSSDVWVRVFHSSDPSINHPTREALIAWHPYHRVRDNAFDRPCPNPQYFFLVRLPKQVSPGDLWFMGQPVHHYHTVINDLCIYSTA